MIMNYTQYGYSIHTVCSSRFIEMMCRITRRSGETDAY